MSKTYNFAVIIPNLNRYDLLDRALHSLVGQTCKDFCCVVVDDGSDNVEEIEKIVKKYESILDIVFHKNNETKWISYSRNIAAKMIRDRVRYICFLDSDDEFYPRSIEIRKEMVDKNPQVECLVTGFTLIWSPLVKDRDHPERLIHVDDCGLIGRGNCIPQLSLEIESFFRIWMFHETGLYCEDIDIVDRCKSYNLVKEWSDEPSYIYHREPHDEVTNL